MESPIEERAPAPSTKILDRLRSVVSRMRLESFTLPVTVHVEDKEFREAFERMGCPPYVGMVQIVVTVTTRQRPFEGPYKVLPDAHFQVRFNKCVDFYHLSKMTDREMAMLVREHVVIAVVHEIDEHLLFDNERLFEPHPGGGSSFEEGPWPPGVWHGRRLSPPR